MSQILSDAALACPGWSDFYAGGVLLGALMMFILMTVFYLGFLRKDEEE
jgi:hypothetical protein